MKKLGKEFFSRDTEIVARELLGKVIVVNGKKARIVETEAYLGEKDPASYASKGENKVSKMMIQDPGRILVYNVHMYKMLNFVTDTFGKAGAVLIRAVEPLNFNARCNGPGLLTLGLGISDDFHGRSVLEAINLFDDEFELGEIVEGFRIGVTKDLDKPMRFYIKDNAHVSRK